MAVYVWKCQNCDHEQKIERPISEYLTPPESCENCQDNHIGWTKVWTPASFVLNGGGWYKDGYQKPTKNG